MNTRKLTAPYFFLQSLTVLLWWLTLWVHPPSRLYFLPPGGADVFLLAFGPPDIVLIVVGGFVTGALCRRKSASAGIALWVVVVALSYGTLYCLALSFFTNSAWISVAMFVLLSLLGIWGGITMALNGDGTPLPVDGTQRLVARGPYAYLRNPMAVAGLGQGLMVGLHAGSWLTILYVFVGGLIWNYIARPMEEADMAKKFGASYERYTAEVKCWRPRLTPFVMREEVEAKE